MTKQREKIPYITSWKQCESLHENQVFISDMKAIADTKERQWQVARNNVCYIFAETYSLRAAILIARAMIANPKWRS